MNLHVWLVCRGNRFGGELEERLRREWGRLGELRHSGSGCSLADYAGLDL